MYRRMGDSCTFAIADVFSTVEHANLFIVVAGGRVVERGSHGTFYAAAGLYRRLYDMQFRT